MMQAEVERLLRDAIGLHVETVGGAVVRYALKQRMAACGFADLSEYWRLLTSSRQELQELVDAVVVPETWFFRDREAFAAMARHARAILRPGLPIRMLSLPCSSGEEPYSMAMAMFDAGFAASDFTIEGVDVSTRNVAEATRAIYGRNSFRGAEISFRGRYFDAVDGGYRPIPALLKQVGFKTGNLFDPAVTSGTETYDVVFCRNLLIYFDRELQQRALERLRQVLLPNGLLLVGPAESSLPTLYGFASVRTPLAFAFVKQATQSQAAPLGGLVASPSAGRRKAQLPEASMGPTRKASPAASRSPAPPARPMPFAKPRAEPASLSPPEDPAQRSLDAIERAANAGHLEEAKQAARRHIETFGPSPGVFYLLGLAHDASRAVPEAIENYRKALYLAPDHRETLVHLSLLLQHQGDIAGAKALNSRLGRIQKRDRIG